jgi:hypothetical protein
MIAMPGQEDDLSAIDLAERQGGRGFTKWGTEGLTTAGY